jgi:hypothetical protein
LPKVVAPLISSAGAERKTKMFCPHCGAHTEVTEKRTIFRDRRCMNIACGLEFTTRENVLTQREHRRLCARTRESNFTEPLSNLAARANGDSASPSLAAPSDPSEDASAMRQGQTYLQAEVGA